MVMPTSAWSSIARHFSVSFRFWDTPCSTQSWNKASMKIRSSINYGHDIEVESQLVRFCHSPMKWACIMIALSHSDCS